MVLSAPHPSPTGQEFFPSRSPHREDPHPYFDWARQQESIVYSPAWNLWMVTKRDDVLRIVEDPQTFSSVIAIPPVMHNPLPVTEVLSAIEPGEMLITSDEPAHAPLRSALELSLNPARIRRMSRLMTEEADRLLDEVAGSSSADLVADYATPFVQFVIHTLIGFPLQDVERVQGWSEDFLRLVDPFGSEEDKVAAAARFVEYDVYLGDLVAQRRAQPQDDLISDFLTTGSGDGRPLREADIRWTVKMLRIAGFFTTRHTITNTCARLLEDRSSWDAALAERRLVPRFIEETLRRDTPTLGNLRLTTREVEVGGVALPAHTPLFLLYGAANRDPGFYAGPAAFDPERPDLREHLAFGQGLHACPGQQLSRTEVRIAIDRLLDRLPGLRADPRHAREHTSVFLFCGLDRFPVVW